MYGPLFGAVREIRDSRTGGGLLLQVFKGCGEKQFEGTCIASVGHQQVTRVPLRGQQQVCTQPEIACAVAPPNMELEGAECEG